MRRRHRLQVRQVRLRVVVEDHARIEQAGRVEQTLDLAHQRQALVAPLAAHERGHVAAGAVLGLEGAVVAADHQPHHVVHEGGVALHLGRIAEVLREDEVQVALEGMAEDDGLVVGPHVAVPRQEPLQVERGGGQVRHREGHVLDHDRGARPAPRAHRREGALAHLPEAGDGGGIGAELDRRGGRQRRQRAHDGLHLRGHHRRRLGARFHQQRGRVAAQGANRRRHAGLVLHAGQRSTVHQLHRGHRQRLEQRHRGAGIGQAVEQQQRGRLVRVLGHRAIGDGGQKAERALGADHQVRQDVDRIGKVDERVQAIAGGVLEAVLGADATGHRLALRAPRQRGQPQQQRGVRAAERRHAGGLFGVQQRAVGQDDPRAGQRVVAVVAHAAAHAAGVVGGDAADLGRIDGGRVGPDLAAEGRQQPVGVRADDSRLQADGDGLPRQAGAGSAAGQRRRVAAAGGEHLLHLVLAVDGDHQLRHEAIEARVGAVGKAAQRIGDDGRRRQRGREVALQGGIGDGGRQHPRTVDRCGSRRLA